MGDRDNSHEQSKPRALVILAEGAEEMEVVITVDVLRRGGINVTLAGFYPEFPKNTASSSSPAFSPPSNDPSNPAIPPSTLPPILCSRDVLIVPDTTLEDALKSCMAKSSTDNASATDSATSTNVPTSVSNVSTSSHIPYDVIIIPGGMQGAKTIAASKKIGQILKRQEAEALGREYSDPDANYGVGLGSNNADNNSSSSNIINSNTNGSAAAPPKKYLAAICAGPLAFLSHGIARNHRVTSHPSVRDRFTSNPDSYTYVDDAEVVVDGPYITSRGPGTAFAFALAIVAELQSKKVADSIVQPMILKNY